MSSLVGVLVMFRSLTSLVAVCLVLVGESSSAQQVAEGSCNVVIGDSVQNVTMNCFDGFSLLPGEKLEPLAQPFHARISIFHDPREAKLAKSMVERLVADGVYSFIANPYDPSDFDHDLDFPTSTEVRFFHSEARPMAFLIAARLDVEPSKVLPNFNIPNADVGEIEIWLGHN
jgi:hypothetical protein